jgi:hypothetical protein
MKKVLLLALLAFSSTAIILGQERLVTEDSLHIPNLRTDSMSTLKIQRLLQFQSLTRKVEIIVNGKTIGKLANGETRNFTVKYGTHHVFAKLDWCKSPELTIDIPVDSTKTLVVNFTKSIFNAMYQCVFERNKYISLTELK